MLVLDIPRECPPSFSHVEVPLYHRVHLGLAANRTLHCCLLAASDPHFLPELVVSPFEFDRWDKTWRLNMTVVDRTGLFNDVCNIFKQHGTHVLAAESSTTQQRLYQLEVVIALEDPRKIEWIRLSLLTKFVPEMTFLQDDSPRLRIQKLQGLWDAKRAFDEQRDSPRGFRPQQGEVGVSWSKKTRPQMVYLGLPEKIKAILKSTVGEDSKKHQNPALYLRQSDTKNRFLRVLYFRPEDAVIHARIEYPYGIGATASITEALKDNKFNILTAYLGPSGDPKKSRLELVTRCDRLYGSTEKEIRAALEGALSSMGTAKPQKIVVQYPTSYYPRDDAQKCDQRCIVVSPKKRSGPNVTEIQPSRALGENLGILFEQFRVKIPAGIDRNDVPRWKLVKRLLGKYEGLVESEGAIRKVLFVSCKDDPALYRAIEDKAESKGFAVVDGRNLLKGNHLGEAVNDGLIRKINSCTHFLGVWSLDGAVVVGKQHWPSPWLLWEFGVAEAFGLTWKLLIDKRIDKVAYRIVSHQPQRIYEETGFESGLGEVLDTLSAQPAGHSPFDDVIENRRESA